jgi:cysteinyl-tRNA synthetase
MKTIRTSTGHLAWYLAAILLVACANQLEPAKNALDNINSTLSTVSADAQQYVPDQLAQAQSKVADLNTAFANKDYAAVVARAPAVLAEVQGLAGAAAAKKDEILKTLGSEWRSLEASIPQSVSAVQARIDELSKSRHVPKDVDLGAAKSALADAGSSWDKAQSLFKAGNAADAVTSAKDARSKLESAAAALKLHLPDAS